jgi:hypothetical protein
VGIAEPALRNECVQRKGGGRFPAGKTSLGRVPLCPEWQQPPQTRWFAGVVVAGISSPGVFRRNATAGLPVNGIYPLIPIQ